jgi:WD40 repeat protein
MRSNAVYVYDRTFTNCVKEIGPHIAVDALALSPDRRWVVTGSSQLRDVRVWDLQSGQQVFATPTGRLPRAAFSGNGKWLSLYGDKLELREVGSWKPAPALPLSDAPPLLGPVAFSPDGRLLALVADQHEVQLFDLAAWQFIGVLRPALNTAGMNALAFSADGTRLAAACAKGRLRIWNLHGLRQHLASFDLDWELPSVPLSRPVHSVP